MMIRLWGRQSVKNEEQLQLYIIACETTSVAKIQVENGSVAVGILTVKLKCSPIKYWGLARTESFHHQNFSPGIGT